MNKSQRHAAIRTRARDAIHALYHNATPSYPRADSDAESDAFQAWFEDAARDEIDYIESGGAYGSDYAETLRHPVNAGRYQSAAARAYYVRKGMDDMRREREGYALWERISEYGELFQFGRGGRTLAPATLYRDRGASSGPNLGAADEGNIANTVEMLRIIESFNAHVAQWCASVPEMWAEEWAERTDEANTTTARALEATRPDMYPEA